MKRVGLVSSGLDAQQSPAQVVGLKAGSTGQAACGFRNAQPDMGLVAELGQISDMGAACSCAPACADVLLFIVHAHRSACLMW